MCNSSSVDTFTEDGNFPSSLLIFAVGGRNLQEIYKHFEQKEGWWFKGMSNRKKRFPLIFNPLTEIPHLHIFFVHFLSLKFLTWSRHNKTKPYNPK